MQTIKKDIKEWIKTCLKWHNYIRTNSPWYSGISYFGQVFVSCMLINKNFFGCFLLILCKEHTLTRSNNLLGRNHPTLCFGSVREGLYFIAQYFMIRSNCPEPYNEFLDSYLFNIRRCLFRIFPESHFWNHT